MPEVNLPVRNGHQARLFGRLPDLGSRRPSGACGAPVRRGHDRGPVQVARCRCDEQGLSDVRVEGREPGSMDPLQRGGQRQDERGLQGDRWLVGDRSGEFVQSQRIACGLLEDERAVYGIRGLRERVQQSPCCFLVELSQVQAGQAPFSSWSRPSAR